MPLPATFMVSAGFNRYVMFECQHIDTKNVKLKTVDYPSSNCIGSLRGDESVVETGQYINERTGGDKTPYRMVASKLNRWLEVGSQKIYEYAMEMPCLCLPIEFHQVYVGNDSKQEWHLIATPVPYNMPIPQIPSHVLKGFVNGLIAAKEICPVTMDELTLGNIAITECCHAFERGALYQIMATTLRCPTCRALLKENPVLY
jgi:hypothetical protein